MSLTSTAMIASNVSSRGHSLCTLGACAANSSSTKASILPDVCNLGIARLEPSLPITSLYGLFYGSAFTNAQSSAHSDSFALLIGFTSIYFAIFVVLYLIWHSSIPLRFLFLLEDSPLVVAFFFKFI